MSEKQTMSITRALAELKRLDDRINRETTAAQYVGVSVGKGENKKVASGSMTVTDLEKKIKSTYDSITDLFTRRATIKSAIVLSNAKTLVTINGKKMTVAEAIELKQSINLKRTMVQVMQHQAATTRSATDTLNQKLETKIEGFLTTMLGGDKTKVDTATIDAVSKTQRDASEAGLIDPLGIADRIEKLQEEIAAVDTELDFTLSEINSKTEILV